jgi:hypothetical protein
MNFCFTSACKRKNRDKKIDTMMTMQVKKHIVSFRVRFLFFQNNLSQNVV